MQGWFVVVKGPYATTDSNGTKTQKATVAGGKPGTADFIFKAKYRSQKTFSTVAESEVALRESSTVRAATGPALRLAATHKLPKASG